RTSDAQKSFIVYPLDAIFVIASGVPEHFRTIFCRFINELRDVHRLDAITQASGVDVSTALVRNRRREGSMRQDPSQFRSLRADTRSVADWGANRPGRVAMDPPFFRPRHSAARLLSCRGGVPAIADNAGGYAARPFSTI